MWPTLKHLQTWALELNQRLLRHKVSVLLFIPRLSPLCPTCVTDKIFSLCLMLSNRLAADLLEQRWRSPVAQVGGKRVFFKAHWEQHVRDEWQGAPAADQRGFPLPISSFRWESGSCIGSAWKIWPVLGLSQTCPDTILSTEGLNDYLRKGRSTGIGQCVGKRRFPDQRDC